MRQPVLHRRAVAKPGPPARAALSLLAALGAAALLYGCGTIPLLAPPPPTMQPPSHVKTDWEIKTSLVLEAVGLISALSGDPLVTPNYTLEVGHFRQSLTPAVETALANLRAVRDNRLHVSLNGTLNKKFLFARAETLDDMLAVVQNPEPVREAVREYDRSRAEPNATYYTDADWKDFEALLPDLQVVIQFLKDAGFQEYWEQNDLPQLKEQVAQTQAFVHNFNVVAEVESHLGFSLSTDKIVVYLVYFSRPFGNHVVGTTFVTETRLLDEHIVRTAVHELMHPPFDYSVPKLWETLDVLKQDPLIKAHYEARDPNYGYNNWAYFFEESTIRALEQHISEELGVARDLGTRWGEQEDGGMFAWSPIAYSLFKSDEVARPGEGLTRFLLRAIGEGRLTADKTRALYDSFFAAQGRLGVSVGQRASNKESRFRCPFELVLSACNSVARNNTLPPR